MLRHWGSQIIVIFNDLAVSWLTEKGLDRAREGFDEQEGESAKEKEKAEKEEAAAAAIANKITLTSHAFSQIEYV